MRKGQLGGYRSGYPAVFSTPYILQCRSVCCSREKEASRTHPAVEIEEDTVKRFEGTVSGDFLAETY